MNTKIIDGYNYIQHQVTPLDSDTMQSYTTDFYNKMDSRRTVRHFSNQPIDKSVIENILKTASTAPSGAHKQPWTFCIVSNTELKKQIRAAAEEEEKLSYTSRMSEAWKKDLAPLGTNWEKPFLEIVPYIIVVFKRSYEFGADGSKHQNYYVTESCGLACGFLLAAIHHAGLGSLTHTPSPMNFLTKILNRPENEKPFLLIPVGHIDTNCWVPDIQRKPLEKISEWYQ
jgi:iodotyrosine deiodinase